MLKLIYHTTVFGPIDLAYDRPIIRVGHSEDNDLVLAHHSIEQHHCLLVFRGEQVLCLPPDQDISSSTDLQQLTGPEFGPGELLRIGDLQFTLAHSSRTVALPGVYGEGSPAEGPQGEVVSGAAVERRHYCPHCRAFVPDAEVKHMGLVGQAKRNLCPKCGHLLESEAEPQKPSAEPKKPTQQNGLSRMVGNLQARLTGGKDL